MSLMSQKNLLLPFVAEGEFLKKSYLGFFVKQIEEENVLQLSTVLFLYYFSDIFRMTFFCYFNYSFYSHIVEVFSNLKGHWTTGPRRLCSFSLCVLMLVKTSTSMLST